MKIKQLLEGVDVAGVCPEFKDVEVKRISCDSRDVTPGTVFVAVRGPMRDGHKYIDDAVKKRASAIILEDRSLKPLTSEGVPFIIVNDSKEALSKIADTFFGYPYQRIKCVGITGTNGKTTVSYLVKSVLNAADVKCGLIGTIGYKVDEENIKTNNTTPGVLELHELMSNMAKAGDTYVALEVSSHALDQERVKGIIFRSAIFTNLTQDHLDYHKTMEDYFLAKQKLFTEYADENTDFVINKDEAFGQRLARSLKGRILTYGFSSDADVCVMRHELSRGGSQAIIKIPQGVINIVSALVGRHNLYNIMAAVAFGVSEGLDQASIKKGIEAVSSVPGRLERIDAKKGFSVFVDYAHTDDALKNVLESLRLILHNGRIIIVFGCGGDRDKGKRPKMGRVASVFSDYCFVTSDNPRSEEPEEIIEQIIAGIEKNNFEVEPDRFKAIQKALTMAAEGDFVLVAGKGHETYQTIKDRTFVFDDKSVVLKILSCPVRRGKPESNV
ncbi:MAG: UDP-N-acetylmuramoyl-L-alanyl-D-glutamate--2,6-diaminopimelate ligase [Candidatus Omnitrophota bacterium]